MPSHCRTGWGSISPKPTSPAFGQFASCCVWQSSDGTEPARHRIEEPATAPDFERWLAPAGALLTVLALTLYALNRLIMRGLFRLRVTGATKLPEAGAFVITPNHVSDLDGLAIAAALPWSQAKRLYWAGDAVRMFSNPVNRLLCRALHVFPVDADHPAAVLENARRVLKAGRVQVWFPEAWRSPDGQLQRFLPGIGQLLLRSGAPAVPAYINGTFQALPRGRRLPRLHPVTVTFGSPEPVEHLRTAGAGRTDEERISAALRERVAALGAVSHDNHEAAAADPPVARADGIRR